MENKYINRYRTFCKCIDNLKKSKMQTKRRFRAGRYDHEF